MQQDEEGFQLFSRHIARPQGSHTGPVSNRLAGPLTANIFNALQEEGERRSKGGEEDHNPHG